MKGAHEPLLLQVAQLGNPIIRQSSEAVENIKDEFIQSLVDNLIATVKDVDGVGIAAPQVYQALRIFIVASYPNPRYPNAPKMKPTAIINPEIISTSEEMVKGWEGCLSIPGIRSKVLRHKTVVVEYYTREGKKVKRTYKDFVARIFQHEYDHLEGVVFFDHLVDMKETITEKEYQKLMKEKIRKAKTSKKKRVTRKKLHKK